MDERQCYSEMSVFLHKFQHECKELAIDARAYMTAVQGKEKDFGKDQIDILERLVQRKALTYIVVTMNLFAFKYLPALERGEGIEAMDETIRAIPQAMTDISNANEEVFKRAYSICMRAMRLSNVMSKNSLKELRAQGSDNHYSPES